MNDQPPKKLSEQGVQQSEDEFHKKETIQLLSNKTLPALEAMFAKQNSYLTNIDLTNINSLALVVWKW